ncbi:N-acetyltransferase family protein [Luteimonas sp. e5]
MVARNRLPPWHEELRLANGREILIRPIRPEDGPPIKASFALLEPDEVRNRYLHHVSELSDADIERLTRPDPRTEFTLVAAEPYPPGEALIGAVGRVFLIPGTRNAEYAILVSKYIRAMGLGRHLMLRLVRWARGQKVERMYGDVFDQNLPMLALCESLGFTRHREGDTPGLFRVVLDLREQHPDE